MTMSQATVRISERTRETLREIARQEHASIQAVLEKAVEEYRRKRFLEDLNAEYAELRKDPEAWSEIEAERALWDATLADGLPTDEVWDQESRTARKIGGKRPG
jgi:predicted transcriptional regulator